MKKEEEELVISIDLQRRKHEEIGVVKNRKTDNVEREIRKTD